MNKKTIPTLIVIIFLISILSTFVVSYAGEYNSTQSRHPLGTYTYQQLQKDKEIYNAYRYYYDVSFMSMMGPMYKVRIPQGVSHEGGYNCIENNQRLFKYYARETAASPRQIARFETRFDFYCGADASCHGAREGDRQGCNLGQVCSNNGTCIWKDQDLDTYPIEQDCDDQDSRTYPNAEELCDNKDNDCDGTIDEGVCLKKAYICDTDNFTFGTIQSQESCPNQEYCSVITNERTASCSYITQSTDLGINDFFVFICDAFFEDGYDGCERFTKGFFHVCEPYETSCTDNIDNDCDGKIDSQDEECTCTSDDDCISNNPLIGNGTCINGHCDYDPITPNITQYCSPGQCDTSIKAWCDTSTSPYSWNTSIEYCTTYCQTQDPEYCQTISPTCIENLVCYPQPIDLICYYHQECNPTQCVKDNPSCPSSCENNQERPCPFQYGVCLGSQQTCINQEWPGCSYNDIIGYSPNEICGDFIDNNCNGLVDENCVCIENETITCGSNIGACGFGYQACEQGRWSQTCQDEIPPVLEICDSIDNDCDGTIDEDCSCTEGSTRACGSSQCGEGTQTCTNGQWGSCLGLILPSPEICDGIDNDCDNAIDEGCSCTGYESRSCGSTIGICTLGTQECLDGIWSSCVNAILPESEVCDDDLDNDCDGSVDEGCTCTEGETRDCPLTEGVCEDTLQECVNNEWETCDYPDEYEEGEEESCSDDLDNDCDDLVDEYDEDCEPSSSSCEDGTYSSDCSTEKPLFCSSGVLEERCSLCGCSYGLVCRSDGTCGSPTSTSRCGDGMCEGGETCVSCQSDCGRCSERPGGDDYVPPEDFGEAEEAFPWWILILIILLVFGTLGYLYYTQNPYLIKYFPVLKKKPTQGKKQSLLDKIKALFKKKTETKKPSSPFLKTKFFIPPITKRPIIRPITRTTTRPLSEAAFKKLKEYIKKNLDKKHTYSEIKQALLKANWKNQDIERAYREVR